MANETVIQLLSDLHLERLNEKQLTEFFQALEPEGVDILVLAGDICSTAQIPGLLPLFCRLYADSEVVYVAGNHEYYGSHPDIVHAGIGEVEKLIPNFTWLHNRAATVRGLRFVGGTLWFPRPSPEVLAQGYQGLNDFHHIQEFEPWVYNENTICEAILRANLPTADVVVTHHIPTGSCVSPRFRMSPINHYFCRDLTLLIEEHQPPLWLFGHTHDRMWTYIKDTKLACNPLGYLNHPEEGDPARGAYADPCLFKFFNATRGVIFAGSEPGGPK